MCHGDRSGCALSDDDENTHQCNREDCSRGGEMVMVLMHRRTNANASMTFGGRRAGKMGTAAKVSSGSIMVGQDFGNFFGNRIFGQDFTWIFQHHLSHGPTQMI